ncbi:MAG: protein kinase [Pirellulales bacterium]|nr:protein kinase [Pirellulales bacterium]
MLDDPSPQLLDLLSRLQLATPRQVRACHRRARRLARGVPLIDLVWIDALVQKGLLTPYQAHEIHFGRGEGLLVGPYLLKRLTARWGYADSFMALDRQSARRVQLTVARADLVSSENPRKWTVDPVMHSVCGRQWLACQGRFAPAVALEIARQVATELAALESTGTIHGDVSASALQITSDGRVYLTRAGLRSTVRLDETENVESLPADSLDTRAPERITRRSSPSIAADIFSFGCLCWHLLTGRTPLAGGNRVAKLAAIAAGKIPAIRRWAPETPRELVSVIECCTKIDELARLQSFADVAKQLGPPTPAGRRSVIEAIARGRRSTIQPSWRWRVRTAARRSATQCVAAVASFALLAAATWPLWRPNPAPKERASVAQTTAALRHAISSLADSSDTAPKAMLQLASYQASEPPARPIVELPSGEDILGSSLRLQVGAIVRGQSGQRVRILAPPSGVAVNAENIRFENVDFIWRHRSERITAPERTAIVEQRSRTVEFIHCTFQAAAAPPFGLPPAVRLIAASPETSTSLAPACRVRLERCCLKDVASVVDGDSAGPMAIELYQTLHMARGPLVRLATIPTMESPVSIELKHVTARGTRHGIEFGIGRASVVPGNIHIEAVGCVLALDPAGALIAFIGSKMPKPAAGGRMPIEWTGQGSLADANVAVAIWHHDGTSETVPEDSLAIEGLVAGKMEFAGSAGDDPATSRLMNWQAPLISNDPPGIGDSLPTLPPFEQK